MNLRMPSKARKSLIIVVAVLSLTALGWTGYSLTRPASVPEVPPVAAKSSHPSIAQVRERMLRSFHGEATNRFTSIPGFGFERMTPLYKEVPFELPFLSTGEIETDDPTLPTPPLLAQVFAATTADFHDPSRRVERLTKNEPDHFGENPSGFAHVRRGTVNHGLQLRMLDLIGVLDRNEPKAYSGGKAFEVVRMSREETEARLKGTPIEKSFAILGQLEAERVRKATMTSSSSHAAADGNLEQRPLDLFEFAGVAELLKGQEVFLRRKGNIVRMLGALRATEDCLKCHGDFEKGDLLGAFSYTFVDTNKSLEKRTP